MQAVSTHSGDTVSLGFVQDKSVLRIPERKLVQVVQKLFIAQHLAPGTLVLEIKFIEGCMFSHEILL